MRGPVETCCSHLLAPFSEANLHSYTSRNWSTSIVINGA
jgi:hypothetical protein